MSDQLDKQAALAVVEGMLREKECKPLTDVQRIVFLGCWEGKSYQEIHRDYRNRYELDYFKRDVGPKLWRLLTQVFDQPISKNTLRGPIETICNAPRPIAPDLSNDPVPAPPSTANNRDRPRCDWENAPEVPFFCGRERELETLEQAISLGQHRLVAITGMGKVGKTALAVKLAEQIRGQFDCLMWRSLHFPRRMADLVQDFVQYCTDHPHPTGTVPPVSQLLDVLRNQRCLLILDGLEGLLQPGVHDGSYQPEYQDYRYLLEHLSAADHQSCIILTTRELPKELNPVMTENDSPVCVRKLSGLGEIAMQEFLNARAILGAEHHWRELFHRYGGNPFVLDRVCRVINEVFYSDLSHFLNQPQFGLPKEVKQLLQDQLTRLSDLEGQIIECLTHVPAPITIQNLAEMLQSHDLGDLIEGLDGLKRRSLVEVNKTRYYFVNNLVREIVGKS